MSKLKDKDGHTIFSEDGITNEVTLLKLAIEKEIPLEGLDARELDLRGFNFKGADLSGADFRNCSLMKADFSNCTLQGADFSDSYLSKCNFSGANISLATFYNTSVKEVAKVEGVNFSFVYINQDEGKLFPIAEILGIEYTIESDRALRCVSNSGARCRLFDLDNCRDLFKCNGEFQCVVAGIEDEDLERIINYED